MGSSLFLFLGSHWGLLLMRWRRTRPAQSRQLIETRKKERGEEKETPLPPLHVIITPRIIYRYSTQRVVCEPPMRSRRAFPAGLASGGLASLRTHVQKLLRCDTPHLRAA